MNKLDKYRPRPKIIRYLAGYFTLFIGSLLCRIKVTGRQFIPAKGPFIVAINHFSVLDPVFVIYGVRRPINFLMASDQVVNPGMVWAPWMYGFIPTNRSNLVPSTIKESLRVLKRGEILGIFPEATSTDTVLRPAKDGAAYLSLMTNVPILPVSVVGTENLWVNLFRGVRQTVQVNIGKSFGPFDSKQFKTPGRRVALKTIGTELMCRIGALLPEQNRGYVKDYSELLKYREENQRLSGCDF